jgi:ABC-type dipeptide/oligopeptide/nickel transport system permease component
MIDGALTTLMILGWLGLFAAVTTIAGTIIAGGSRRATNAGPQSEGHDVPFIIPALAIAPVAIFSAWATARVNLIFPVFEFTDTLDIFLASLTPALILLFGSGLFWRIISLSRSEWSFWYSKPFVRVERAFGKDVQRRLSPMIVTRIALQSGSDCLPLIFSELVIIESIFNAPGLGFWSWEYAKTRDVQSALTSIAGLFVAYGLVNLMILFANRNLGKKLAGYL